MKIKNTKILEPVLLSDKPRVGVRTVEGTAIGFVFADHITTVSRLRNIIADQVSLHEL